MAIANEEASSAIRGIVKMETTQLA